MRNPYQFIKTDAGRLLLVGDILVLVLVTLSGFASHNTLGTAGTRMLTTMLPWTVGWFLIAPWLGLFDPDIVRETRELWRPFWALALASPLAAYLRGWMIGRPSSLVFTLVMIGVSGLAMVFWRALCVWRIRRNG
ncbi:MAG: DUF3054 domain-containing protein [Anaerolineae bacterium]|nr:MAG: DUF3054 domain-containing protein [Anaerolineae bacterium]